MSGIKGMKKYPQGIKEKIVLEYNNGVSQRELSKKKREIDEYIHFYNNERIQLKTKLTPLEKRCQYVI